MLDLRRMMLLNDLRASEPDLQIQVQQSTSAGAS